MNFKLSEIKKVYNFSNNFTTLFNEEFKKLPYHINLIDEIHADENSHSRIFAKILAYKENNKHVFLEKFINELCGFNLPIEDPKIEKVDSCGRIDIPIIDNKYFIIIENKVTAKAIDQNNSNGGQLARYIQNIKEKYDIKLEQIYIVYTPKFNNEPLDESWKKSDGISYKEEFKNRYISLSYRDKIYPWLKNEILQTINTEKKFLHSAIYQYLDHLEGMFNIREINKPMNIKLQEFIKKELHIQDENLEEAIKILDEKINDINVLVEQITLLKSEYKKQKLINKFARWKNDLQIDFPNLLFDEDNFGSDENYINLGVDILIDNSKVFVKIESNDYENNIIYIGLGKPNNESIKKINHKLKTILKNNNLLKTNENWYGWKDTSMDNCYLEFKKLISECIS